MLAIESVVVYLIFVQHLGVLNSLPPRTPCGPGAAAYPYFVPLSHIFGHAQCLRPRNRVFVIHNSKHDSAFDYHRV